MVMVIITNYARSMFEMLVRIIGGWTKAPTLGEELPIDTFCKYISLWSVERTHLNRKPRRSIISYSYIYDKIARSFIVGQSKQIHFKYIYRTRNVTMDFKCDVLCWYRSVCVECACFIAKK